MNKTHTSASAMLFLIFFPVTVFCQLVSKDESKQWEKQAKRITIIRDNWGVPHIYGKTDADAAFGMMYAQCEDNFWQVEETYIRSLGRSAELYGVASLDSDAAVALSESVKKGKETYEKADISIRILCNAAAAGINFYLLKHAEVKKRLLQRYEPWFFLLPSPVNPATHGITQSEIKKFTRSFDLQPEGDEEWLQKNESGSNAIAIAPSKSESGNSMLLINPHVALFGGGQRYEAHLVNKEGLNVSGFAMLGSFYIWSGFTHFAGWSHTNTASDYEDVYLEKFNHPTDPDKYLYENNYLDAIVWTDTLLYLSENILKKKVYQFRKTHHGPVSAKLDSLWITVRSASSNTAAYISQAWKMCKARDLKQFTSAMENVQLSTNTMYADRFGNIAYWHGNAIPVRDEKFEWRLPVDGSNKQTDWKGLHPLREIIQVINPFTGWIQNCNSTPFMSAGAASPKKEMHRKYMSYEDQNFRGDEAVRLLSKPGKISLSYFEQLVTSNNIPMMAAWLPRIINAYDNAVSKNPDGIKNINAVVDTLRNWNNNYSVNSKATTIAVSWYLNYMNWMRSRKQILHSSYTETLSSLTSLPLPDSVALQLLLKTADTLNSKFGTAFIEWGKINRLQRIHTSGSLEKFDDSKFSLPVSAVPGGMGSLFAFNTRTEPGENKMYGISGNSYVGVIDFGKKIKARSIVYFGQNSDPASPHYFDQAPMYAQGNFKEVWFYKNDVEKNAKRRYHPGE
ncbi:MAG: penicillin acylase family protein [Ferruginibacter sp.]